MAARTGQMTEQTVTAQLKVQHVADPHIDHPQKSLVLSFELALVEYLNSYNRRIFDGSRGGDDSISAAM